jgi:hypothetical protein
MGDLPAFAAIAIERFEQRDIGAGKPVGLSEVLAPTLENLFSFAAFVFVIGVSSGDRYA